MNGSRPFSNLRPVRNPDFFCFFYRGLRTGAKWFLPLALCLLASSLAAQTNGAIVSPSVSAPALPAAGTSLLRVTGALALVLGIFLGGAWLFKNWQRLAVPRGRQPKLNILETRSLGPRQAVIVVGYDRQRFLVAASTAGVNLLTHLPDAEVEEAVSADKPAGPMPFSQALAQVLKRK